MTTFLGPLSVIAGWDRPAAYHRVLLFALRELRPDSWSRMTARAVCRGTGLSPAAVERALSMLQADQVILGRGAKSAKELRLSNRLVWKGLAAERLLVERDPELEDARGR